MGLAEYFKKCTHQAVEEVKNGFGVTIGGQCSRCTDVVWGVGKCDGCKQPGQKLTLTIQGKAKAVRFCDTACQKLAQKYKRSKELFK